MSIAIFPFDMAALSKGFYCVCKEIDEDFGPYFIYDNAMVSTVQCTGRQINPSIPANKYVIHTKDKYTKSQPGLHYANRHLLKMKSTIGGLRLKGWLCLLESPRPEAKAWEPGDGAMGGMECGRQTP